MDQNTTAVERAFQLAKSGDYATVADIVTQLLAEKYSAAQITDGGNVLRTQLAGLIKAARGKSDA
jgi:hypothetical protein